MAAEDSEDVKAVVSEPAEGVAIAVDGSQAAEAAGPSPKQEVHDEAATSALPSAEPMTDLIPPPSQPGSSAAPLDLSQSTPLPDSLPSTTPTLPTPDIIFPTDAPRAEPVDRYADPSSAASQAALAASQWNSLLHWSRKARGPQWDWGTGMYHVPIGSTQYYANVTPVDL